MNNTNKFKSTKISYNKKDNQEDKKNNKKWLLLLLLLLFLCVFGFLLFKIGFNYGTDNQIVTPKPKPSKFMIKIEDDSGTWGEDQQINIFTVAEREYVAPYDSGVYEFEVANARNKKISYSLSLIEDNEDQVNIKYKLKKNGEYITGANSWVYFQDIQLDDIILKNKKSDMYQLEWMWVSENNELDTAIGKKEERATYSITIKVVAAELEG